MLQEQCGIDQGELSMVIPLGEKMFVFTVSKIFKVAQLQGLFATPLPTPFFSSKVLLISVCFTPR